MRKVYSIFRNAAAVAFLISSVGAAAASSFFSELGRFKYRIASEKSLSGAAIPYAIDSRVNDSAFERADKKVFLGFDAWLKSVLSDASAFFSMLKGKEINFRITVRSYDPGSSNFDFRTAVEMSKLEIFGVSGFSASVPLTFSMPEESGVTASQGWRGSIGDLSDFANEVTRRFNEKKYLITFGAAGSLEDLLRRNLSKFIGDGVERGGAFQVATFEVFFYGVGGHGVFFSFSTGPVLFFAVIDDVVADEDGKPCLLTVRLHALPTQGLIRPWLLATHSVPEEMVALIEKTERKIAKATSIRLQRTRGTLLDFEPRNEKEKAALSELLQLVALRAVFNNQDPDIVRSIWTRVSILKVDPEAEFEEGDFMGAAAKALYKGPLGDLWQLSSRIDL